MKMKKVLSLVVLVASFVIAQTTNQKSLLEIKQELSTVSIIQPIESSNNSNQNIVVQLAEPSQKKSPGIAILCSLLLPGMGELYANGYDSGKYFTIADGVLWGTLAGLNIYGNWKQNNYESFAGVNADANFNGKDADFKANVGIYMSMDQYNKEMDLNGSFDKVYKTQSYNWNWQSNDQRKEYRDMWSSSEAAFNNIRFVAGALILNRVISVINAVRLVSAYNKNLAQEVSWNVYFGVQDKPTLPQTLTFNFIKAF
jgi:hypothetical protein